MAKPTRVVPTALALWESQHTQPTEYILWIQYPLIHTIFGFGDILQSPKLKAITAY